MLTLNQGLFTFPCSASEQGNKKPGRIVARTVDPNCQRDLPHHRLSFPEEKMGGIVWEALVSAQAGLGISQWVLSNCIEHHLFFLEFDSSLSLLLLLLLVVIIIIISIIFYFISIIKLFLSQLFLPRFYLFPILLPVPLGVGWMRESS